jgi:hypothetical protein
VDQYVASTFNWSFVVGRWSFVVAGRGSLAAVGGDRSIGVHSPKYFIRRVNIAEILFDSPIQAALTSLVMNPALMPTQVCDLNSAQGSPA